MRDDTPNPQINAAKISIGGGAAGAIIAAGSMMIFLVGVPAVRYMFPAALVVGCGVALVLHFIRHEATGAPWIRSATKR